MVITGACIAGVADVSNHLALLHEIAFRESLGVVREMRVIVDELLVRGELIDRGAAAFALKEFDDLAVGSGDDGSFRRSDYIDGVVRSAFRSCVGVRVE